MKTHIIILAAGKGLRMKSSLPKVLHKVGNLSMLEHVIKSTKFLNPSSVNVVVGKNSKLIQDSIINADLNWVVQDKQIGTADAVKIALPNIYHIKIGQKRIFLSDHQNEVFLLLENLFFLLILLLFY